MDKLFGVPSWRRTVLALFSRRLPLRLSHQAHQLQTPFITTVSERMVPTDERIRALLGGNWSTEQFDIEYPSQGFHLSNHLSHGVVALMRLEASRSRIEEFVGSYQERLVVPKRTELSPVGRFDEELFGKHERFYDLVKFYESEIAVLGSADAAIKAYFPQLVRGIAGVALHGIIHLGYGYNAKVNRLVAEGLGYIHCSFVPMCSARTATRNLRTTSDYTKFSQSVLSALEGVTNSSAFAEIIASAGNEKGTGFQKKMYALSRNSDLVETFTASVLLPKDTSFFTDLLIQLLVSTCSDSTVDFFILHGVTSSWSMQQVMHLVKDPKWAHYCLLNTLIAVYVAQGCPELRLRNDEVVSAPWGALIKETIEKDRDEHVYKLVQVAWERSQSANPSLPENTYKLAAQSLLSLKFRF